MNIAACLSAGEGVVAARAAASSTSCPCFSTSWRWVMIFCVTCKRVRLNSASASLIFAWARRMSGFVFMAVASISSRPGRVGSLFASGGLSACAAGLAPGPEGSWPQAVTAPRTSTNRLAIFLRILSLLLSGVLQGHHQPVGAVRDVQRLRRQAVQPGLVAAQGGRHVPLREEPIAGTAQDVRRLSEHVPLTPLRRRGGGNCLRHGWRRRRRNG